MVSRTSSVAVHYVVNIDNSTSKPKNDNTNNSRPWMLFEKACKISKIGVARAEHLCFGELSYTYPVDLLSSAGQRQQKLSLLEYRRWLSKK